MKKIALIVFIALSGLQLAAQVEQGDCILSADVNYQKTTNGNGVSSNFLSTQGKYLTTGASVGYFVSNKFVIGLGFDYNHTKEINYNELLFNKYTQIEVMEIKSNAVSPNIYASYYQHIAGHFYVSAMLRGSYAQVHSEITSGIIGADTSTWLDTSIYTNSTQTASFSRNNYYCYGAELIPEINYFLTQRFALTVGLGGIKYFAYSQAYDSNFSINFNPNNWKLGVKVRL